MDRERLDAVREGRTEYKRKFEDFVTGEVRSRLGEIRAAIVQNTETLRRNIISRSREVRYQDNTTYNQRKELSQLRNYRHQINQRDKSSKIELESGIYGVSKNIFSPIGGGKGNTSSMGL